ncbi:MAG: lmo0937 family membrane protein [Patescibacteria group bacterium]
MLTTIAIVLLVLWAVGFLGFQIAGGLIHVLLAIAIIVFAIRLIQGRNPVQ